MDDKLMISFTTLINDYKESYGDLISDDIFDDCSELISIVKRAKQVSDVLNRVKFTCFIKGISKSDNIEKSYEKLNYYISKKKYSQQIVKYIESVHHSNSMASCFLLGILMSHSLNSDNLSYSILNLQNSLCYMTDYDIRNLFRIIEYNKKVKGEGRVLFDQSYVSTKWCEENGCDRDEIMLTADKFSNHIIFNREMDLTPDLTGTSEYEEYEAVDVNIDGEIYGTYSYTQTDSSKILFQLIDESKDTLIKILDTVKNVT